MQLASSERCRRCATWRRARKGEVMKRLFALLVALLAAIGAATVVFFWRKNHRQSWDSSVNSVKDSTTPWGKTATDQAGKAAAKIQRAVEGASDSAFHAADEAQSQLGREF